MKAVLLILGAFAAGAMAQSTTSCPQGSATCDAAASASATADHPNRDHEDNHNHETGTGTLGPSPTNSGECHDMGDHWHCSGAKETGKPGAAGRAGVGVGAAAVGIAALGM